MSEVETRLANMSAWNEDGDGDLRVKIAADMALKEIASLRTKLTAAEARVKELEEALDSVKSELEGGAEEAEAYGDHEIDVQHIINICDYALNGEAWDGKPQVRAVLANKEVSNG